MKSRDFEQLLASVDQARKINRGKLKPSKTFRFNHVAVKNIRKRLHVSQTKFAYMIGVSVDTLQNWEQGRRRPKGPALALLKVAQRNPEVVLNALHT